MGIKLKNSNNEIKSIFPVVEVNGHPRFIKNAFINSNQLISDREDVRIGNGLTFHNEKGNSTAAASGNESKIRINPESGTYGNPAVITVQSEPKVFPTRWTIILPERYANNTIDEISASIWLFEDENNPVPDITLPASLEFIETYSFELAYRDNEYYIDWSGDGQSGSIPIPFKSFYSNNPALRIKFSYLGQLNAGDRKFELYINSNIKF